MSMARPALAAARWTTASMAVRTGLALMQLVILARLLAPADFGRVALAMTITAIAALIADLGLSQALIAHRPLRRRERSALFWLSLGMAVAVALCVVGLARSVAALYGDAAIAGILCALAPLFVLQALALQHKALAEKALRFAPLCRVEIAAAMAGFVVALAAATLGAGAYALVMGVLATALVTALLCWAWLEPGWRPDFALARGDLPPILADGLRLAGSQFANLVAAQADLMVAGRLFSSHAAGLYAPPRELALRLMLVVNPIVTRIGLPLIAQARDDRPAVARLYAATLTLTLAVSMPLYAAIALFAADIVGLLFGPAWSGSVPLLQALAIWCAVRAVGNPIGSLLVGCGRSRRALAASVAVAVAVIPTALIGGLVGGPVGIPYALALLYGALVPAFWFWLVRPLCAMGFWHYHGLVLRPAAAAALASGCAVWAVAAMDAGPSRLALGLLVGATAYCVASLLVNRALIDLIATALRGARPTLAQAR